MMQSFTMSVLSKYCAHMWCISHKYPVIHITNVRIVTFVPLNLSDPPASILLLDRKKGSTDEHYI
jgi:hypothetical protein